MIAGPLSSCSSGMWAAPATRVLSLLFDHPLPFCVCQEPCLSCLPCLHADFQPHGDAPVSSSAIAAGGDVFTPKGMKPYPVPRALETDEIPKIVEQFRWVG